MDLFQHELFNLEKPAFRLLRLIKGDDSIIGCDIFQASLEEREDAVSYEALSYTWGGNELIESTQINSKILRITKNLYVALQYLRLKYQDRMLWIDAICINQSDPRERMHQVGQMAQMYQHADRVIICWALQRSRPMLL
jgi:hypothetical protein